MRNHFAGFVNFAGFVSFAGFLVGGFACKAIASVHKQTNHTSACCSGRGIEGMRRRMRRMMSRRRSMQE
jgi:hypothetical protein